MRGSEIWTRYFKGRRGKEDIHTLLCLSRSGGSVKKIAFTSTVLQGGLVVILLVSILLTFICYDYFQIRREKAELTRLRQQAGEQTAQIQGLAAKVDRFALRMEELKQFDKKIRIMASLETRGGKAPLVGIGGPVPDEQIVKQRLAGDDKALLASLDKQVDRLTGEATEQERRFQELLTFLKRQRTFLTATPSLWPVAGWVTSEFGGRVSPFTGAREFHTGIDIATRIGAPVRAPADGIVSEAFYQSGMGNSVRIEHGQGMSTWFGHLSMIQVKQGGMVKRGDVVGYVGNSGRSTGSHLHYGVYLNGVAVNPRKYLN